MLIEKLSERYSSTIFRMEEEQAFLELIKNLTEIYRSLEDQLEFILSKSGNPNELHSRAQQAYKQIISEITSAVKTARTSTVVISANKIRGLTEETQSLPFRNKEVATEAFIEAFDDYMHHCNLKTCLNLAACGRMLNIALHNIRLVDEVIKPTQGNLNLPTIKIHIAGDTNLEEFSNKLSALSAIIETCCNLLKMSTAEAAVAIERIESGSFFAKISANPLVVAVVSVVISQGSDYFFAQSALPNEATEIREKSETLVNILKIREALTNSGIPTTELDSGLKTSTLAIAKQLNKLLSGVPAIEVNDVVYAAQKNKLLANPETNAISSE